MEVLGHIPIGNSISKIVMNLYQPRGGFTDNTQ